MIALLVGAGFFLTIGVGIFGYAYFNPFDGWEQLAGFFTALSALMVLVHQTLTHQFGNNKSK